VQLLLDKGADVNA
jgi:ankyrin repeat protein